MSFDWSAYDKSVEENRRFIKIPSEEKTTLDLSNWETGIVMDKMGLKFEVMSVNGATVTGKKFETSSTRLIKKLRPIIDKANTEGKEMISVEIFAVGEAFDRQFEVKEL